MSILRNTPTLIRRTKTEALRSVPAVVQLACEAEECGKASCSGQRQEKIDQHKITRTIIGEKQINEDSQAYEKQR